MKKTTSLLIATVLAFNVFAAEPAANFVVSEFTGSADFGFKTNFTDSNNVQMGMYNIPSTSMKFGFVKGGDKTTTGDGVWGELKISAKETTISQAQIKIGNTKPIEEGGTGWKPTEDLENKVIIDEKTKDVYLKLDNFIPEAKVEKAMLHFSDNKFYLSLDLLKPTLKYEGNLLATATSNTKYFLGTIIDIKQPLLDKIEKNKNELEGYTTALENETNESVREFYQNEISKLKEKIDKLQNELKLLETIPVPTTTDFKVGSYGLGIIGNEKGLEKGAGFGLGFGVKDAFDANFKLVDNGIKAQKDKIYGLAFDLSLTAVKDLTTKFMGTFNFNEKYYGLASQLAYKVMLNDKLFIRPGVSYALNSLDNNLSHNLTGGVLLGWSNEEYKPGFKFFNEKVKEGLSISVSTDLKDSKMGIYNSLDKYGSYDNYFFSNAGLTKIVIGLYDQSLFNILNISEFGTLKIGFTYIISIYETEFLFTDYNKNIYIINNVLATGLKYVTNFGPMYLELGGDMEYIFNKTKNTNDHYTPFKNLKDSLQVTWSLKFGSQKIIDNTDIYTLYEGEYKDDNFVNHAISIGTKIHF